jgi:hypothetical protein
MAPTGVEGDFEDGACVGVADAVVEVVDTGVEVVDTRVEDADADDTIVAGSCN